MHGAPVWGVWQSPGLLGGAGVLGLSPDGRQLSPGVRKVVSEGRGHRPGAFPGRIRSQ